MALLQFGEQFEHLGANGHIERRHGLVGDHERGPAYQRPRDRHALPLAAREFMRVARRKRSAEADLVEHLGHALRLVGRRHALDQPQAFADQLADGHARIERGVRILEHHLALQPVVEPARVGARDGPAAKKNLAAAGLEQPGDGAAQRGLARARATDDRDHLARPHHEVDAVQRALGHRFREQPAVAGVVDNQVAHLDDGRVVRHRARGQPARHGLQQFARVGVLRVFEQVVGAARFLHLAVPHHDHALREAGDHRQVVADHQHGRPVFAREADHQLEHVALHHGVERGGGFVGNQQGGLQQHHRGQHHPLPHAARELVRPGRERPLGVADADARQHVEDARLPRIGRQIAAMQRERLAQLLADRHRRIERGHRLLEHHADTRAAQLAQPRRLGQRQVFALEKNATRRAHQRRWRQAHERARRLRLAAARFADDADHLARRDVEGHVAHDLAAAEADGERQAFHADQRGVVRRGSHCTPFMRGSSQSRTASPSRLMPSSVSAMHRPGRMER
jgi:hypothetical protein